MEEKIEKLKKAVEMINTALLLSQGHTDCGGDFNDEDCKDCKEYYRCLNSYEAKNKGEEIKLLLKSF